MLLRRVGETGLIVSELTLGLANGFGEAHDDNLCRSLVAQALDLGICSFDLANNYGPPPGAAERRFGRLLKSINRNEVLISTKAGYRMWPGPYGNGGSRKHLLSSLDESLRRLAVDYVDIFYSHRPDPLTPIEETVGALQYAVSSGRALYAGVSSYRSADFQGCYDLDGVVVNQVNLSPVNPWLDKSEIAFFLERGLGLFAFGIFLKGVLAADPPSLHGAHGMRDVPTSARSGDEVSPGVATAASRLTQIAQQCDESLPGLVLRWALSQPLVASAVVGVSSAGQLQQNAKAASRGPLPESAMKAIERVMVAAGLPKGAGRRYWESSDID